MSRVGKLLIAHPNLPQSNWFYKTIVYIYNDSPDQGTIGVTINVPTTQTFKQLCHSKGVMYPSEFPSMHKGGPVSEQSIVLLHTDDWQSKNTIQVGPKYRLSSDELMFERLSLGDQPAYWRPFLGLSVWAPGQLDAELRGTFPYTPAHSWLTCDATDDIIFNYEGDTQWKAAVELASQQMINSYF